MKNFNFSYFFIGAEFMATCIFHPPGNFEIYPHDEHHKFQFGDITKLQLVDGKYNYSPSPNPNGRLYAQALEDGIVKFLQNNPQDK